MMRLFPHHHHAHQGTGSGAASGAASLSEKDLLMKQYEDALQRIKELEDENQRLREKQVEINTAKELYLKIFEDFPALIWRSRLDKLCDYFNRTWLEWTGKTFDQEFGNGWAKGVHPDDFDKCLLTYVQAFDNRESFYMEYRLLDKHGNYRWIGDHGRPFYDLDGTTFLGYIGSCYDITENKLNEEKLVQLNATKDKLFRLVAHDLRNPISTFVSLSEFLMENHDEFTKEEMTEIAQQMHQDSKNTMLLLEHLLEWSKSQSDKISFHPEPLGHADLEDLFDTVVSQVDMVAKAKKITIETMVQEEQEDDDDSTTTALMEHLQGDRTMLKTVLRNLIMNAIKFTHRGGNIQLSAQLVPSSSIPAAATAAAASSLSPPPSSAADKKKKKSNAASASDEAEDDETVVLLMTVKDNGVGISKQEIDNLFSLVESARTRLGTDKEGGSGLGLIICKDFIERHNGHIWAESEPGKGTEFKITIPISMENNNNIKSNASLSSLSS